VAQFAFYLVPQLWPIGPLQKPKHHLPTTPFIVKECICLNPFVDYFKGSIAWRRLFLEFVFFLYKLLDV